MLKIVGNDKMPEKRLKATKADFVLAVFFIAAAAAVLVWSLGYFGGSADSVVITAHGETVGVYSLSENREIVVDGGGNVVVIENGAVYMKSADCKNQHCVLHAPIRYGNEQIVCLPNKVLVEIEDNGESEIDTVAN